MNKPTKCYPAATVKKCVAHYLTLFTLALVILGLTGSCAKKGQPTPTKITYAMPITVAAIVPYVALEKGFWKAEGLDVKPQMFSAGRLALDALLAKSTEVMSVSETPLMHAILQGNEIYIVATVTEHQEVKLIARRDHGIQVPADLRGKRVASLPGTNSDYFMYEFLEKNGIPLNEVKVTNMAPPDMVTALIKGDIDAYFAWEPHIYYAQKQLPKESIVFPAGDLYYGRHCVAMNKEFVRSHPEVVEKLIRGFLRAEKFANENPEEAMAIVSKITGMEVSALRTLWPEYKITVRLDSKLVQILDKEGRWGRSQANSNEPVPNFQDYIYTQALSKERPSSVDIRP
jgi:ABC-type nitrate/sulfonate/bicarbonate transport system substrate-binding protein